MHSKPRAHRLAAPDGWQLDVLELDPVGAPKGVVVAGHAMMVDRRTIWRPGRPTLAATLVASGYRVLVPDLRGHGESGPVPAAGADWTYEDLVADVGLYIELARRLEPDLPLALLGHSLFGHTSLAYLGEHPAAPVDAVVALAVLLWLPELSDSRARWRAQRGLIRLIDAASALFGYVPVRRLGAGTADEAPSYWRALSGWTATGRWCSPGGRDYRAALAQVRCPVLHVLSDGDYLYGRPDDADRFLAPLGERREFLHVSQANAAPGLRGRLPDHMGLVVSARSEPIWHDIAAWLDRTLSTDPFQPV